MPRGNVPSCEDGASVCGDAELSSSQTILIIPKNGEQHQTAVLITNNKRELPRDY